MHERKWFGIKEKLKAIDTNEEKTDCLKNRKNAHAKLSGCHFQWEERRFSN